MDTTPSIDNYSRRLIPTQNLGQIIINYSNPRWFAQGYQDKRAYVKNAEYYTLRTLLQAVHNSEDQFRQYEVDDARAKKLAQSIFLEKLWLIEDVKLAICNNSPHRYYIIGGRHRLTAIVNTLAQVITSKHKDEDQADSLFELILDQEIRCAVVYLTEFEDLTEAIEANNDARTMRKAEKTHIELQKLGGDAETVESVGTTIFSSELTKKEMYEYGAQNFTRRGATRFKPQTLYIFGERVAKWALFGLRPGDKVKETTPLIVSSAAEFDERMDLGWDVFCAKTEGVITVAKNVNPLSAEIVAELDNLWT